VLANRKGVTARWGLKEAVAKPRLDEQEPDRGGPGWTSEQMNAKSIPARRDQSPGSVNPVPTYVGMR